MKKVYTLLFLVAIAVSPRLVAQKINSRPNLSTPLNLSLPVNVPANASLNALSPTGMGPNGYINDRCGFVGTMNEAKAAGFNEAAFEVFINQKIAEMKSARPEVITNYIIPVVFHVISDGTAEGTGANISAAQINAQIDQLNKDYRNLSGSPFAVAANTGLTFCPVKVDPNGVTLAQPGIDRLNRITKGWTDPTTFGSTSANITAMRNYINGTIKPASIWDPTKYVNIWTYNFINSGLLGYATFPTAGLPDLPGGETATTAGVVFLSGSVGSVTSPGSAGVYGLGRTVTHELGHFFGLYHTWGDVTTCAGTDYCADTPPCSDQYYSGVPTCTAPVQCSGLARMIQDYMDYSDDGCMNTFTQNQVDRIQAVMLAAPRRPRNPAATLCTPAVGNALRFLVDASTVSEASTAATCPKYTDYVISVAPAISATGNATVNFTFGGTATQNVDYTVVGATSATYINGESAAKSVTIRVIDDAEPETSQTIVVGYTISGTGVVVGSTNQTQTITIVDNDIVNFINNTTLVTTLLTENFNTPTGGALPTGWIKGSFLSPAGTNVWTVNAQYGASTGFTAATNGKVLHVTNGDATTQTAETAPAAYTLTSASNTVVVSKAINTTGYQNIKVTFDYVSNGEADANGVYDFGTMLYTTATQTTNFFYAPNATNTDILRLQGTTAKTSVTVTLPAAAGNVANLWIAFDWQNDDNLGNNPPFIIDNVVVTGENSGVETVLNQGVTQTHNQAQTEQYMSSTNKIIAAITNPNANIGCNTATVLAAGTGQVDVLTTGGLYKRSSKVIKITPAVANTTATYNLTLYYTTAELAIWGANAPLLKILKVADGVSLSSTLNSSNSKIFSTTVDDQRATKGYVAYTASVTGGFSQFMLASSTITIPVTLVSFDARPNGKNILLSWGTATEINNKGFAIERSVDGLAFQKIGWVDGKINSSQLTRYSYIDNYVQPNVLYYYRLRLTDLDSHEKLSETRNAKIGATAITVTVSPNPANDHIKIFVAGSKGRSDMNMINAEGQVVRKWTQLDATSAPATLDVRGLASGVYLLQVINPESVSVEKLIIK